MFMAFGFVLSDVNDLTASITLNTFPFANVCSH